MSRIFGPMRQLGYVVNDVEAAMKHWTEVMGVGPFVCIDRPQFIDFRFHDVPQDLQVSAAFGQCGPVQIELVQRRNDAPSMYLDFNRNGREGLQHIAFWQEPDAYQAILKQAIADGFTIAMSGATVEPTGHFVYFDQKSHDGTAIELSCRSPKKKVIFDKIAEISMGWDGSKPVRTLDDL